MALSNTAYDALQSIFTDAMLVGDDYEAELVAEARSDEAFLSNPELSNLSDAELRAYARQYLDENQGDWV